MGSFYIFDIPFCISVILHTFLKVFVKKLKKERIWNKYSKMSEMGHGPHTSVTCYLLS